MCYKRIRKRMRTTSNAAINVEVDFKILVSYQILRLVLKKSSSSSQ